MKPSEYFFKSFINSLLAFTYISAVSWFLFNGEKIFDKTPRGFLIPIFMLLLFVISALMMGILILGKPVILYLGGFKKEAINLLLATLGWLAFFAILVFVFLTL